MKYLVVAEPKRDTRALYIFVMVVDAKTKKMAAKMAELNSNQMQKNSDYKALQVLNLVENELYRL